MSIEVGEYVRTKDGIIAKCIEEKQDRYVFNRIVLEQGYYNDYILKDIPKRANFIIKHSKDIIDLIEVGDYVNGYKVIFDKQKSKEWYNTQDEFITCKDYTFENDEIKSIVTHKQFKNMEYRV